MPFVNQETYYEPYDEALSGGAEGFDEEAEILPFIPSLVGQAVGGVGQALGNLFNYRPNAPVRPTAPPPPRPISTAMLNTPQGAATIRLPGPAVSQEDFQQFRDATQKTLQQLGVRADTLQKDIGALSSRTGTVATNFDRFRAETASNVAAFRKSQQDAASKLERYRRDTDERLNMTMMMSIISSQFGQQDGSEDDMMLLLPMMMMMGSSSSDRQGDNMNNMMPMMMAMVLMGRPQQN